MIQYKDVFHQRHRIWDVPSLSGGSREPSHPNLRHLTRNWSVDRAVGGSWHDIFSGPPTFILQGIIDENQVSTSGTVGILSAVIEYCDTHWVISL